MKGNLPQCNFRFLNGRFFPAVTFRTIIFAMLLLVCSNQANAQCYGSSWGPYFGNLPDATCSVQSFNTPSTGHNYWNGVNGQTYTFTAVGGTGWTTPHITLFRYNGSWQVVANGVGSVSWTSDLTTGNNLVVVYNGSACAPAWPGNGSAYSAVLQYRNVTNASMSASVSANTCGATCNGTVNLTLTSPTACGTATRDDGHYEQFNVYNSTNISVTQAPYSTYWTNSGSGNAGVDASGQAFFTGPDGWSHAFYTNQNISRQAGRVFQGRWYSSGTGSSSMVGWKNTGTGNSYTDFTYALYPYGNGGLQVYEDGNYRGDFTSYASGIIGTNKWIDFKIVLKATGADYYLRDNATAGPWRLIYSSSYSTAASLKAGATFNSSCCNFYLDDLFVGGASRFPLTCYGSKTWAASDQWGNVAVASATVGTETTAPTVTPTTTNLITVPALGCKSVGTINQPTMSDVCEAAAVKNVIATSGLVGWYRADAGVVMDDAARVAEWRDMSGNNNHITQTGYLDRRPTYVTNAINGQPTLRFTTNQFMTSPNVFTNPQYTVITISKMNSGSSRLISSATTNWLLGYHGGAMDKLYANNWISPSPNTPGTNTAPHMYTVTSAGNNSTTILYDFGVQLYSANAGNPSAPGSIQLNGYTGAINQTSNGDISEVIVYNRVLSTAEREAVEGYLSQKYAVSAPYPVLTASQTYSSGNTTVAHQAADRAGNRSANFDQTVSTTAFAGPTVTATPTALCAGSNVSVTLSGMAPAGNKLTCSASANYLNPNPNPVIGSNWTIEAWYNASALPANAGGWNTLIRGTAYHHIIIDRGGNGGSTTGQLGTYVGGFQSSGFNIIANITSGWHHIAAVGTGGLTRFYVDGVVVGTTSSQPTDNIVAIGNFQGGGQHFGEVDEVRIWNVALPQNTISLYQNKAITNTHPNWANLVSYYKMDGNGNDSKGSSPGTLTGGATASAATAYYTYNVTNNIGGSLSPASPSTSETYTVTGATVSNYIEASATANSCTSTTSNAFVEVRPTITPSISGTVSVCQGAPNQTITFTNIQAFPITITYKVNGGVDQTINVAGSSTATVSQSAATVNAYIYTLHSAQYQTAPTCPVTVSGSATVTVHANPSPPTITATETWGNSNNDGVICNGNSVVLNSSASASYLWSANAASATTQSTGSLSPTSNTTYSVTITDGNGCQNSNSYTVTVNSNPSAPTITATETSGQANNDGVICNGFSAVLNSSAATSYLWSANAASATTQSTGSLSPSGNTAYSVTITDANGCKNNNSYTVTVTPLPTGVLSGTTTICYGQTTSLSIAVTGTGPWSGTLSDGTNFSGNSSPISVAVTPLSNTTYTIATLNDALCTATGGDLSGSAAVTVNFCSNTWVGGTTSWHLGSNWSLGVPPNHCSSDVLIPTAPVGGTFPTISSTDINVANIEVQQGATVTVNGGRKLTVCGNWTGGSASNATVSGSGELILSGSALQTISGKTRVNQFRLDNTNGAQLQNANSALEVNLALELKAGNLAAGSGSIVLKSDAANTAYLDNFSAGFSGTYTGNLTVERYISNTADGYRNISSPVSANVSQLADDFPIFGQNGVSCWYAYTPYPNVQIYSENMNNNLSTPSGDYYTGWLSRTGQGNVMGAMQGYAVRTYQGAPFVIDIKGTPNNGPLSRTISHTVSATPSADGWNFIGNPYASPIDWNDVQALNSGIDASYYAFNTTGEYSGNYSSYNGVTGTNGGTRNIASMQGFFVKKTAAGNQPFVMDNTVREAETNTVFHKGAPLSNEVRLELSGNGNSDEIVTYTDATATINFDAAQDALKMPAGSTVYMSYQLNGKEYAINAIDQITDATVLPLVLWARDTGVYTLNATELNLKGLVAYLKDTHYQSPTLLSTSGSGVQLTLHGGQTYQNRYSIVFKQTEVVDNDEIGKSDETTGTSNPQAGKNTIRIYSYDNVAVVERSTEEPATISVTNLIGQTIKEVNTTSKRTEIELGNDNEWYAIVKVKEANQTKTGKVLIK
ncbi:MAG: hypothetical protein JNK66_06345 [Chitinophagales bacterium]|nr:hypothetical protein [Chitinophagales bacterium]